jgi:hypothetical protein
VVVSELPAGHSRTLAAAANEMAGRDGASLWTKAEYKALYGLLLAQVPPAPAGKLRLLDEAGRPKAAAAAIQDYIGASLGKPEFFGANMYMFQVTGFRPGRGVLTEPVRPARGAGWTCGRPIRPTASAFRPQVAEVSCSARRISR